VAVALEQLPPRDRLVLTLLYLESRSVAEAAELAGWSESMVKVQAHRARQKLRALLEQSRLADAKEN
jgi:RNA polymerase sigma-70 factor (ECF subfamily)